METKICIQCGVPKLITEFYNRHSECKLCTINRTNKWRSNHSEAHRLHNVKYRKKHAKQHKEYNLNWNQTNVERMREIRRKSANKINSTIKGKLDNRMRSGIYQALQGNKAGRSWETLVGYNIDTLKQNLESKFLPGMSWDNIGQWHIDHKVPKTFFEYNSEQDQEFQYCWSLDNLQPLWAKDNLIKKAKLI